MEAERRKTDTVGWTGEANAGLEFEKNKTQTLELSTEVRAQYKTLKNIYLAVGEYNRSSSSGETFKNNAYGHLRYNRKINTWLTWEIYSQIQFNDNANIQLRLVNGTGPRFRLLKTEKARIYTGTSYMYAVSTPPTPYCQLDF